MEVGSAPKGSSALILPYRDGPAREERPRPRILHAPSPVLPLRSDSLQPPYISQRTPEGAGPDFDGSASCGPACMAMIARVLGYGRALDDHQLVVHLGAIGSTNLEFGTEVAGMVAMASAMGRGCLVRPGDDLAWMRGALRSGGVVVANGEYYVMPPHEDPDTREGHFVLVYGLEHNGDFRVHDPEDPAVRTVKPADMARFLREHDKGGFQLAVEIAPALSSLERSLIWRPGRDYGVGMNAWRPHRTKRLVTSAAGVPADRRRYRVPVLVGTKD